MIGIYISRGGIFVILGYRVLFGSGFGLGLGFF